VVVVAAAAMAATVAAAMTATATAASVAAAAMTAVETVVAAMIIAMVPRIVAGAVISVVRITIVIIARAVVARTVIARAVRPARTNTDDNPRIRLAGASEAQGHRDCENQEEFFHIVIFLRISLTLSISCPFTYFAFTKPCCICPS